MKNRLGETAAEFKSERFSAQRISQRSKPLCVTATRPLDIVSFLLTPQDCHRKIAPTFQCVSGSGASEGRAARRSYGFCLESDKIEGEKRAVFAGLDRAVY